jgi:hypothetical protein
MTEHFTYGDIIRGSLNGRNEAYHPIIYFKEVDSLYFQGGMITHSSGFENIKLEEYHFNQKLGTNPRPSFFVKSYLLKKQEWGPFIKVGELSKTGIEFVKSKLEGTTPQVWEDYLLND